MKGDEDEEGMNRDAGEEKDKQAESELGIIVSQLHHHEGEGRTIYCEETLEKNYKRLQINARGGGLTSDTI